MWNVFDLSKNSEWQGTVTNFTEVNVKHNFFEVDTLTFSIPFTSDIFILLEVGKVLQKKGSNKGFIIHTLEIDQSSNQILGYAYGMEALLNDRILLYPRGFRNMSVEYAMHTIVDENMINADLSYRNYPNLIKSSNLNRGFLINEDFPPATLYDVFKELTDRSGVGFKIFFDPRNNRYTFTTRVGVNHTVNQSVNKIIRWKSEFGDTYEEVLTHSEKDFKTSLFVVSGDEDPLFYTVGDETAFSAGLFRKEAYYEASDITKGMKDKNGTVLTNEQVINLLKSRGRLEKLKYRKTDDYTFNLNQVKEVYGVDYLEGDFVSVANQSYNLVQHKQISTVEEIIQGNTSTYTITFKE